MLFSIVIPTFNRLSSLPETLASVESQSCRDFETIVVDHGSTDGTNEYLRSRQASLRSLQVPHSGSGPGAPRNAGAHEAKGDYLAFLDSDDLWFPWTLEVFAALIDRHGSPALLTAAIKLFNDATELAEARQCAPESEYFPDFLASSRGDYCVGSGTMIVRRDVFTSIGGFDSQPMNMEDHDLALRLGCESGFVAVRKPVTLGWRRHEGSVSMDVSKSLQGARHIIDQEKHDRYPGGSARKRERRRIITAHVRPVSLDGLRRGHAADAWYLYQSTLRWHVLSGRWRFLLGFPLLALIQRSRVLPLAGRTSPSRP